MHAEVLRGQLTYVDTEEGQIQLTDRADHEVTQLDITSDIKLPWEKLVGGDVEAVVIDGKTKDVYLLTEEE